MNRNRWLILFIVAGCLFAAVGTYLLILVVNDQSKISRLQHQQTAADARAAADLTCVTKWANATSARSAYLQRYLRPRTDAQNALSIAIASGASNAEQARLRAALIRASKANDAAQKRAPLPPPPLLNCQRAAARLPTTGPAGPRSAATTTRAPSTAPASPQTRPATTTATGAAPGTNSRAPAPARTATSTASTRPPSTAAHTTPAPAPARSSGLVNGIVCPLVNLPLLCPTPSP